MNTSIQSGTNILTDNWSFQVIADFLSSNCDPSMDWGWIGTNERSVFSGTIKSGAFQIDCLISLLEQILFVNKIYVMKEWVPVWYDKKTDLNLLYSEDQNGIIDFLPLASKKVSKEKELWTTDILPNLKIEEKFSKGMEAFKNGTPNFWSQVINGIAEYLAYSTVNNLTYSPHPARSGYLKSTVWNTENSSHYPTSGINKFNHIINKRRVSLGSIIGHDKLLTRLNTHIPSAAMLCIADSSSTCSPIEVALQMRNSDEIKNLREVLHNLTIAIGKTENGLADSFDEVNFYVSAFESLSQKAEDSMKIPVSLGGENKPGYVDLEYFNFERHRGEGAIKSTDISKHAGIITRLINTGTNHTQKILETKLKIRDPLVFKHLFNWHNSDFFKTIENKQIVTLYKIVMEENNYINKGTAGIVGPDGKIFNSTFEQTSSIIEDGKSDSEILAEELTLLLKTLKEEAIKPEQFSDCATVAAAQEAAKGGDKNKAFEILKKSGKWVFDTSTQIGIRITAAFLKEILMK